MSDLIFTWNVKLVQMSFAIEYHLSNMDEKSSWGIKRQKYTGASKNGLQPLMFQQPCRLKWSRIQK